LCFGVARQDDIPTRTAVRLSSSLLLLMMPSMRLELRLARCMVPTDAVLACLEWAAATAAAEGVVDDLPGEAMEVGGEVDGRPAGPIGASAWSSPCIVGCG